MISIPFLILLFPFRVLKKRRKEVQNLLLLVPYLHGGGAERACVTLANSLKEKYNITIAICKRDDNDYKVDANIVEIPELRSKWSKAMAIYKLKKLKRKLKIDICISYLTTFNFLNIASFEGETTILSNHNYLSKKKEGFISCVLHRIASFYADKIVNCSETVQYDQIKTYPLLKKKMVVIPNFVDIELVQQQAKEKIKDKNIEKIFEGDVLFFFGRLEKVKRNDMTILAYNKIYKALDNVKLVFLGNGSEKEKLKELVKDLHLEQRVFFLDYDPNPYKYLSRCKIFISSSEYEGLPITILEAMALHVPVVATDCYGGNKEVLTHDYEVDKRIEKEVYGDYGILFPMGDSDALARILLNLMKNKKLQEEYRQRTNNQTKYNREVILEKWKELLQNNRTVKKI